MLSKLLLPRRQLSLAEFFCSWLVVGWLTVGTYSVFGGQYLISTFGADEGMPQSSVMGVAQTPDGYLWIGTIMGGVSRFDGLRFVNFDLEGTQGQGPMQVNRLFTDSAGRLWVHTFFGLWRYDAGRFVSELPKEMSRDLRLSALAYSTSNQVLLTTSQPKLLRGSLGTNGTWAWDFVALPAAATNSVCRVDPEGAAWYLTGDNQLGRLKDGRHEIIGPEAGLPAGRLTVLTLDVNGKFWVGSDRGLAHWEADHFVPMVPTNGPAQISVTGIYPMRDGSPWVIADRKLRRMSGRQWVTEAKNLEEYLDRNIPFWGVNSDGEDGLWLMPERRGLLHIDGQGEMERLSTSEGLPSNLLRFQYPDREGNLWTGCDRGGLVCIRKRLFNTISKAEGLADTVVSSVCEDQEGVVWIGTVGGTLGRWQNGFCTNLTLPKQGRYCQNLVVYPDREGRLWIGTEGNGVYTYQQGEFKRVPLDLGLMPVRMILEDHAGRIWIGTKDSLYFLENGKWTLARSQGTQWSDFLAGMAETADGTLWVGVDGGYLLRYDGKAFKTVPLPPAIPGSRLWMLWPAEGNGLWIGSYASGLLKLNGDNFEQYLIRRGSRWSRVTEGLTDNQGNLWLGTGAGIERVTKATTGNWELWKDQPGQSRIYGRSDGLLTIGTSVEFQPRCWKGHDGRLWFGMANGVAYVNPDDVRPNLFPPKAVMEEVQVDGHPVPSTTWPGDDSPAALTLSPGRHELEIRFTAPTMVAPEATTMRYRLRGLDDQWTSASIQRKALYHALPPGNYMFEANAANRDGVPSQNTATLAITVLPHFWQTRWFLPVFVLGLIALTGAGVTAFLRTRHRRKLAQVEAQRALERERRRMAQDLHDDLGAGLTEIGLLAGILTEHELPMERIRDSLGRIAQRTRYLVTALDEIVWAINSRNDSVDSIANYMSRYAQEFFEPTGMQCQIRYQEGATDTRLTSEQRHHLFLAFKEALANVANHSKATQVTVEISLANPGWLEIRVADNGVGLPDKIRAGADGLTNLQQRMQSLGGVCRMEPVESGGLVVSLKIPLTKTGMKSQSENSATQK